MKKVVLLATIPFLVCASFPGWTQEGVEIYFIGCVVRNSDVIQDDTTYSSAVAVPEFCGCLTTLVATKFTEKAVIEFGKVTNSGYEKLVKEFSSYCFSKMWTYKQ